MEVPAEISEELVLTIWRSYYKDSSLTINSCKLTPVGESGDYYSSRMVRAVSEISIADNVFQKRMLIKTTPSGEAVLSYVNNNKLFETEIDMLENVLPRLELILKNAGIHKKLAPKLYYTQTDPMILAMEDLGQVGFVNANRYIGLCLEECKEVMETLAYYHAASLVYLQENSSAKENYKKYIWGSHNRDSIDRNVTSAIKTIIQNIDSWSSNNKWSEKLKELLNNDYLESFYKVIDKLDESRTIVLNHGDLWHNNLMFRHNSPIRPEVCFVDYQLSWATSPVFDILYFIFTSPRAYVRFNCMEEILKTYHSKFIDVCNILGNPTMYTYENLLKDFKENLVFGFVMFHYVYPLVTAPANNLQNAKENDDYMNGNPAFFNPIFQNVFVNGMTFFEEHQLIE